MLQQVQINPDPYQPYFLSQAIRAGNLMFVSGQAGYGEDGRIVAGGFAAQGEQAFFNLERVLQAGGSSLGHIVKVTIFLTDMRQFNEVVRLRRKFLSAPYPADSIVEVTGLYTPEAVIEIEAIAVSKDIES
ncbi:MAG: RidA family protein [Steroidobacteraceae bacterium]|jgi:reactive intermediate/imine deaminase